jgi:hypothetical protein
MRRSLALLAQAAAKAGAPGAGQAAAAAGAQPRARKQAIELTDAAAARIRELLEQRHKVRGRGGGRRVCSRARALSLGSLTVRAPEPEQPPHLHTSGLPQAGRQEARVQRPELHAQLRR